MDFVKVKGKEFYYKGKPILFSGLGVGSWLNMEHFMLGLPGTDTQIRKTFSQVLGKGWRSFFRFVYPEFPYRGGFPIPEGIGSQPAAGSLQLPSVYR